MDGIVRLAQPAAFTHLSVAIPFHSEASLSWRRSLSSTLCTMDLGWRPDHGPWNMSQTTRMLSCSTNICYGASLQPWYMDDPQPTALYLGKSVCASMAESAARDRPGASRLTLTKHAAASVGHHHHHHHHHPSSSPSVSSSSSSSSSFPFIFFIYLKAGCSAPRQAVHISHLAFAATTSSQH